MNMCKVISKLDLSVAKVICTEKCKYIAGAIGKALFHFACHWATVSQDNESCENQFPTE